MAFILPSVGRVPVFLCRRLPRLESPPQPTRPRRSHMPLRGGSSDEKPVGLRRECSPIRDRGVCRLLSIVHGQRQRLRRAAAIGPWHKQRRFDPSPRCRRRHHRAVDVLSQRLWARGWRCNSASRRTEVDRLPDAPRGELDCEAVRHLPVGAALVMLLPIISAGAIPPQSSARRRAMRQAFVVRPAAVNSAGKEEERRYVASTRDAGRLMRLFHD